MTSTPAPGHGEVFDLSRLARLQRGHFWFEGRRSLVERALDRHAREVKGPVADLGCGTGWMLPALTRRHGFTVGVDRFHEGLAALRAQFPEATLVQSSVEALPLGDGTLEMIVMLDLLEHVDDRKALAGVLRALRPGGVVLITVPAMPGLWSHRDDNAGHLRRYTARDLEAVLVSTGFERLALRYCFFLLLPLLAASRWLARRDHRMTDVEECRIPLLNGLMSILCRLEAAVGDWVSWPCGSSLLAVFRKPHLEA